MLKFINEFTISDILNALKFFIECQETVKTACGFKANTLDGYALKEIAFTSFGATATVAFQSRANHDGNLINEGDIAAFEIRESQSGDKWNVKCI